MPELNEHTSHATDSDFENIVDIAPFPILIHKMGIIRYANALCLDLFGTDSLSDIIGINILEFTIPEDRATVIEAIEKGSRENFPL